MTKGFKDPCAAITPSAKRGGQFRDDFDTLKAIFLNELRNFQKKAIPVD